MTATTERPADQIEDATDLTRRERRLRYWAKRHGYSVYKHRANSLRRAAAYTVETPDTQYGFLSDRMSIEDAERWVRFVPAELADRWAKEMTARNHAIHRQLAPARQEVARLEGELRTLYYLDHQAILAQPAERFTEEDDFLNALTAAFLDQAGEVAV